MRGWCLIPFASGSGRQFSDLRPGVGSGSYLYVGRPVPSATRAPFDPSFPQNPILNLTLRVPGDLTFPLARANSPVRGSTQGLAMWDAAQRAAAGWDFGVARLWGPVGVNGLELPSTC